MPTANNLEKLLEVEAKLKAEYQQELNARAAEIDRGLKKQAELQAVIDRQLETITDLSSKATANQRVEQLNRELTNRSENLQEEIATLKKRVKTLQQDLAQEREQVKALSQYDAPRMKKNLDASKKKLAEQTRANELLQKSLQATKSENAELQRKVKELEEKLAEFATSETDTEAAA